MIGTAEIEKMSLEEKLETMELLWKSIHSNRIKSHPPDGMEKLFRNV